MPRLKFDDGIYQISNADYHASEGLSRTGLMLFKKSPFHFWYEKISGQAEEKKSKNFEIGELFHTLLLEPHRIETEYAIKEKFDKRKKDQKEAALQWEEANAGKIIIEQDVYDLAFSMAEEAKKNDLFSSLFDGAKIEHSIYFTHEQTGLQCKVRPDAWLGGIVTDLKTTEDADYRNFQSSSYKYGYFVQAGMMHCAFKYHGLTLDKFVYFCSEKKKPHAQAVYVLDGEALDYGVAQFNHYMKLVKQCLEKNEWPSYGVRQLFLPSYARYEMNEEFFEEAINE